MLTCPHLAVSLHLHVPHCPLHKSCQCHHAPHDCMHCIAVPLTAVCIALPCPSQVHTLHCHPSYSCMHHVTMPLMAAHIVLPSPLWLHTHVAVLLVLAYRLAYTFSYFLFLLTSSFV